MRLLIALVPNMAPGPERRSHEHDRRGPYNRPSQPAPTSAGHPPGPAIGSTMQQAIKRAAEEAARAVMQQQQQASRGPPQPASMPLRLPGTPDFVKVSADSDPRKVAGKLAHTCREQPAPAMLTIGNKCINQAVKAICIARGYLADRQIELTCQPAFREGGTPDRPSVALYLSKHPNSHWVPVEGAAELSVSASSAPAAVAGALAARCRENAAASLVGIGMDAVTVAVQAIGHTRLLLEPDGRDVRAWPEFVKVQKNGGELNAIKFHIHVDRLR